MRKMSLVTSSIAVLSAISMVACGGSGTAATTAAATSTTAGTATTAAVAATAAASGTGGSGELNIYTPASDLQYNNIVGAFQKKYPDIKINYTQAGAGECKTRIKSEADNPQGDVMFGGLVYADSLTYGDYFDKYTCVNDSKMPDEVKNKGGVLTYHDTQIPCLWVNDELEKKAGVTIKSYADLLNPVLKGQVASADPTESSSAWDQLECILTDFGGWNNDAAWDYLGKLVPNLVLTDGSSAVYKGVYNGEYTVGLTYESACVEMLSEDAEGVHVVYPAEGVMGISFASAIIKNCKNPDNAKLFLDFLESDECQTIFNQGGARHANFNLKIDNKLLPDLDTLKYNKADTEALAKNQKDILAKWTELSKQVSKAVKK